MITSPTNDKIKFVRRLQTDRRSRSREKLFVVEGSRWASELIKQGTPCHMVFYTEAWADNHPDILLQLQQLAQQVSTAVSEPVMAAMSDTTTPPGILIVVTTPGLPLPDSPQMLLVLDRMNNPGNLGTILRSAGAAGVDGVLLAPGCVDATNPKVVRGSMGALLRLPVLSLSWEEIAGIVANKVVWLAASRGEKTYTAVNWQQPSVLIIGSEAQGAGAEALKLADGRVSIPMHADTESLNAAIAASVILFEAKRQRNG